MNFSEITKALKEISSISSGNEKIEWLKKHDDEDFKELLSWYFDNSYPTGISEKKYLRGAESFYGDELKCIDGGFGDVIDYLKVHNTGRLADINLMYICKEMICETNEERECFKKLVCKNYPMGIDAKTINKVFKNLVPTFDVCLCDKYYDKPELVDGKREFAISTKIDGCRCIAIKENGIVRLISRQGKLWTGLVEVENDIKNMVADNFVLDGELTIDNFMNYPSKDVYKMTTKIVSTKDEVKKGITLNVFDWMSISNWNEKDCPETYFERQKSLEATLNATKHEHLNYLKDIYVGKDVLKIEELMKGIVREEDWEGLVIKFTDSKYEWKRSKNWLKVKAFDEMDLIVKSVEEGSNKNEGTLGALICEIEHPKFGHIEAKVGSGYSDEERNRFWSMKDELIGRVISVQYFEVTKNSTTGIQSLRFPVFLELKEEGQEVNN